ncbi:Eukaryotic initiation factor [Parasponia andersonii]|uniref:Eukaryotic initiation factor n=1 Tax=Parasponia andersonii TaxID=3476 RepID=A0A2P5CKV8_PARAD|nr:Eukaryotic initiation factor [Parasponia andersonii]
MARNEIRRGCLLSWADEVEKEEQEQEEATQAHQTHKPNPFGSARPREVVLQERGIDWRTIDQDLLQPPSSNPNRINKRRNDKPRKEIISSAPASTLTRSQVQIPAPPILVGHCNQIPLRCPPTNGILKWVQKPCISPNIKRGGLNRFEAEKENVFHKQRPQRDYHGAKSSEPKTHKGPCLNLRQQSKVAHGDDDCKSDKKGNVVLKPSVANRRRRRHSVASIKEGTASFQELWDSRLPSCVPAVIHVKKMKPSDESQKSTSVAASECGKARVGQITAMKKKGFESH